jgi:hypothetical protein
MKPVNKLVIVPIVLFLVWFIPEITVGSFSSFVFNSYLHLKNKQTVELNSHKISFQYPYWALFGENDSAYVSTGGIINHHSIEAELFKSYSGKDLSFLQDNCAQKKQLIEKSEIEVFECCIDADHTHYYYFLENKNILIRSNTSINTEETIEQRLKLLFTNIY